MPTLVDRGHGEFIMGGAGAPVDFTNQLAPGTPGENLPGHILENGGLVPAPAMNGGKRKSRTVRRKKRRRTKHKTASRSRTGRRHKKHSKKHPQTRRRKPRSRRRKRRVKVHKQEGKGGYAIVGHQMGAGPHATYGEVVGAPTC